MLTIAETLLLLSAILTAIAYRMAWTPAVRTPDEDDYIAAYYQPLFDQETLDALEGELWR